MVSDPAWTRPEFCQTPAKLTLPSAHWNQLKMMADPCCSSSSCPTNELKHLEENNRLLRLQVARLPRTDAQVQEHLQIKRKILQQQGTALVLHHMITLQLSTLDTAAILSTLKNKLKIVEENIRSLWPKGPPQTNYRFLQKIWEESTLPNDHTSTSTTIYHQQFRLHSQQCTRNIFPCIAPTACHRDRRTETSADKI